MIDFNFIKTGDGSLGLFNISINDIYHAREGAYTESLEKFTLPALNHIKNYINQNELKLCDICYGIGYNTISFIQEFCKTNLISKFNKINISALEYDKNLIILSPFIKSDKYNFIIRLKLLRGIEKIFTKEEINSVLQNIESIYIDQTILRRFKGHLKYTNHYLNTHNQHCLFLHNTYYNYISNRLKKAFNISNIKKICFDIQTRDARKSIFNICNNQNVVFLDAFDPKKLPTLWTKEFFEAIYNKMSENGKLFTYSHSASVRSGMIAVGFFIGNNNSLGTVASKYEKYIEEELSEYEIGLLNTNAGICYRDYNLNTDAQSIINERMKKIKNGNRESSTHYARTHKK